MPSPIDPSPRVRLSGPSSSRKRPTTQAATQKRTSKRSRVAASTQEMTRQAPNTVQNPPLPWTIEKVRKPGFKDNSVPVEIWTKVLEQMDGYDKRNPRWRTASGLFGDPTCARRSSCNAPRPEEWTAQGAERRTCRRCRKKKDVCVAIQDGRMDILTIRDGVYIE